MPRPRTADTCKKMAPQQVTDTKIFHCARRIGHKGDCSRGKRRWKNAGTVSR